jgi:zinc protease
MRKISILLVPLACLCACDSDDGGPARFEIPYAKYTLDNGLEVVLHQDHSDPIVAIATLVHVGSSREKPGKTGFAHFFEHMAFNDSENVPRGANRKLIGELGGTRNGGTWTDGTVFYEVVPKDAFEKLMWIDSDRLGYMINTVTEWALENEKQVVKNEKRERVDNRPYGPMRELLPKYLYPAEHPYSWSVIGSLEDLQAATLDDVREFYDRYYGAANATLVIAGDIEIEPTRALVEKWFGEIRRGPDVPPLEPLPAALDRSPAVYHVDNFAKLPELHVVYPTVEMLHEHSWALDALASILAEGKRAPLYNVVVEERKLAPEVSADNASSELAGTLTFRVRAHEGVDLDDVLAAIDAALARFEEQGFLDRDLARIKAEQETRVYNEISSVLGKAFQLATYNEFAGDPGYLTEEIERIRTVTREDVLAVYDRYVKGKHRVLASSVPQGGEALALAGAERAELPEERIVLGAEPVVAADADVAHDRTPTRADRSEPPLGPMPEIRTPAVWSAELANGLRVLGIEQRELPLVEFRIVIEGGHLLAPPDKAGVTPLLAELLTEGTRGKTPEALEDAIGELGARIDVAAGRETLVLSANGLSRHFEALVALATEILLEPRWDAAEFERLKAAQLNLVRQREGEPSSIAADAFDRVLYGDRHVFAVPEEGTETTVPGLALEDLQRYYERNVSPGLATVAVAGDVSRAAVLAALRRLESDWKSRPVEFPRYELPAPPERPSVHFIDVPGSKQSVLLAGKLALPGSHPDYNNVVIANDRLGAGSSSRLFQLLRIEKGYTYGAGSNIPRRREPAPFVASSSVRANVTLESLELLRDQLRGYGPTFTQQDLDTTKNLLVKKASREFETLDDLLDVLEHIGRFDLPLDFIARDQRELMALTLDDVRSTIATDMDERRMAYVVVGDGATQRSRLAGLGYGEPVLRAVHGAPLPD